MLNKNSRNIIISYKTSKSINIINCLYRRKKHKLCPALFLWPFRKSLLLSFVILRMLITFYKAIKGMQWRRKKEVRLSAHETAFICTHLRLKNTKQFFFHGKKNKQTTNKRSEAHYIEVPGNPIFLLPSH